MVNLMHDDPDNPWIQIKINHLCSDLNDGIEIRARTSNYIPHKTPDVSSHSFDIIN